MEEADLKLLERAHSYAREYIGNVSKMRVYPSEDALRDLDGFEEPLPDDPSEAAATLDVLQRIGAPATVAQSGGRYFGFVNGGMLPVGLAARWLADAWDQNTPHYVMSPVAAKLEEVCEGWLAELFDLPPGTAAGFVTGTTEANLSGLAAGRNALLSQQGWDVFEAGLYGAPPVRVVVGAGAHATVGKALSLLGMGNSHTEVVPVDGQGRMRPEALPRLAGPALVVTQAGNVNSGAFDPVGEICDAVHESEGWVHVDGAFGLWASASPSLRALYAGVELADSWAVDAHKTLNAPYDSGIALCRDRQALISAFRAAASYFQWSEQRDPMQFTFSMSKRARAIELWAILKTLGRSGIARLVDQLCARARSLADRLSGEGFRVHNDVVFNQVVISCGSDDLTMSTVQELQAAGEIWCGGSTWNGRAVIRISVCSWATTAADVDRAASAFVDARRRAGRQPR